MSRLRERSRSKSGSNSRQGSRPRSLVGDLGSIQDASPVAARVVQTEDQRDTSEDIVPTVISPWSEPDASLGSHADVQSSGVPERLGVLPSPTAGSFSRSIDSRPRTAVSDLEPVPASPQPGASLDSDQVLTQEQENGDNTKGLSETREREALASANTTPPRTPVTKETKPEERDELYDVTPIVSKSQPTQGLGVDDADDTTPKAVQTEWQSNAAESAPQEGKGETVQDDGMTIEEIARFASEGETMSGAERELSQPQPAVIENPSTEPDVEDVAAASTAREEDDNKSEVSAEDHEENSKEIEAETQDKPSSKRSSVSSLGDRQPRDEQQEVPVIMSSQAVPAGPVYSMGANPPINMDSNGQSQDRGFMNRPYLSRPEIPRPLSYEPRERDSTGELVQETLNTGSQPQDTAGDELNGHGSKPFEANFTSLSRHRKQSQNSPTDRKSKRLSGIFAGRDVQLQQAQVQAQPQQQPQPPPQPQPMVTRAPPASFMPDEYGLGDLRDLHADSHDEMLDEDLSRQNSKQGRRKSGFWEALKRNPSASKENSSRRSSSGKLGPVMNENMRPPPPQGWANDPRRMTVEQPQRAYTTATEPEKKKGKRFSGLGSLFGRSSTTGHKSDKSKKLSKQQALDRENSQIQNPPASRRIGDTEVFMVPKAPPPNTGWIDPYAMTGGRPPPGPTSPRADQYSPTGRPQAVSPPPGGWYGPRHDAPTPPGQPRQGPPPNFSRLPSHGQRASMPMNNVPEGYRSVNGAYNRPMIPMQPPSGSPAPRLSLQSAPPTTSPLQGDRVSYPPIHPALQQQPSPGPNRERQPSSPSTGYALSPQVTGKSDWLQSDRAQRGSMPTISPVESKPGTEGYAQGRTMRVGSISEEIARSPAREYSDQQTPYMLTMPQGSGQAQSTRTSYYARQRRGKPNQLPQDTSMEGRGFGPLVGANPSMQGYPLSQQQTNTSTFTRDSTTDASEIIMAHAPTLSEPKIASPAAADEETYLPPPGPPPSSRTRTTRQEYIASFQRSQPNVNVRTSRDGAEPPREQVQGTNANPYLSLQLPNLGDSNRRDDYSDDERIEMKSASYPGQEWIPSSWNE